jgi:hypothetical protein
LAVFQEDGGAAEEVGGTFNGVEEGNLRYGNVIEFAVNDVLAELKPGIGS